MTIAMTRAAGDSKTIACRLVLLSLLALASARGRATATVEWRGVPIPIVLTVGEERVLAFPDHVQVGVPSALTPDLFRTQSTGGTVLWLARRPFRTQRVEVRLLTTGDVMLFDVTAVRGHAAKHSEPIQVTFPDSGSEDVGSKDEGAENAPTPITLTRFAAQQLYAPQRLMHDIPGIRRVPMHTRRVVSLYRDPEVIAHPLGSWQGGRLYVTAVELKNAGASRVWLDPRLLKGRFVAATFQQNTLGPAKTRSDTTCVYLITNQPFAASVYPTGAVAPNRTDQGRKRD